MPKKKYRRWDTSCFKISTVLGACAIRKEEKFAWFQAGEREKEREREKGRKTKYTKKSVMCEIIYGRQKKSEENFTFICSWLTEGYEYFCYISRPPHSTVQKLSPSTLSENVNLFSWWYKSRIKYDFSSLPLFLVFVRLTTERNCPRGIKYRNIGNHCFLCCL